MIFSKRKITISGDKASIDKQIVLYRGDREIEIQFEIVYEVIKYRASNAIEDVNASFGQLVIQNNSTPIPTVTDVSPTSEGAVIFKFTKEMIDEISELGEYSFQIRLFDDTQKSRITTPIVVDGIAIKEPLSIYEGNSEGGSAEVGVAFTGAARAQQEEYLEPFDETGNYNETTWATGDIITSGKLNKLEDGITGVNQKVKNITLTPGPKGDKGDQGPQGPAGANGQDGLTTAISVNGTTYTQVDGMITLPNYPTGTGSNNASDISITDTANNFTSTNVEDALAEVGSQIKDIANSGAGGIIFENVEVDEIFTSVKEVIKCTEISLSSNILTFTSIEPQTLTATVLPSNCTEIVTWTASPSGIVSISNGVITPLENGECTITVTCGSQSATCSVTISGILKQYSITNNLTNITTNNTDASIAENASYTAILTANENYAISTVTVTMGGADITNTAYVDGVITINAVTGNIVITATANSTIVSAAVKAKIEKINNKDYLVIEDWDNIRTREDKSVLNVNTYSNDYYQMYNLQPSFLDLWDMSIETPFIMEKSSINKTVATSQSNCLKDTQEGDLYLYLNNRIYLRLPKDITPYNSIDSYMKDKYGGMKFALVSCNTKVIDPTKITSINIKENNTNSQYAQFNYSDFPSKNIYNGANSLSVNTASNANLSGVRPPACAMSTNALSIKFLPGTFAGFTLDAVKEYLTKNPLIFWYL